MNLNFNRGFYPRPKQPQPNFYHRVPSSTMTVTPVPSPMDEDDDWGTEQDDEACLVALTQLETNQAQEQQLALELAQRSREDSNRNIKFLDEKKRDEMRKKEILNKIQLETKVKRDDAMISLSQKFSQHFGDNDSIIEDERHREMGNIRQKYKNSMGTNMTQGQGSQGRKKRIGETEHQFSQIQESSKHFSRSRQSLPQHTPAGTSSTAEIQKFQQLNLTDQTSPLRPAETSDNTSLVESLKATSMPDSFRSILNEINSGERSSRCQEISLVANRFEECKEVVSRLLVDVPRWIRSAFKESSCSFPDELRDLFRTLINETTEINMVDRKKKNKFPIRYPSEFPQGPPSHLLENDMKVFVKEATAYQTLVWIITRVRETFRKFKGRDQFFRIFEKCNFENFLKLLFWAEVAWDSIVPEELRERIHERVGIQTYVKTLVEFTDLVFQVEWRFWLHAEMEAFIRKWTLRIVPKIICIGYFNHTVDNYNKLDKILHNTLDNEMNFTLNNLSNVCNIIAFLAPNNYIYNFLCFGNDTRLKDSNSTCLILKLVNGISKVISRDFASSGPYEKKSCDKLSSLFLVYLRLIYTLEKKKFVHESEVAKKWNSSFATNFSNRIPRDLTKDEQRLYSYLLVNEAKNEQLLLKCIESDGKPLVKGESNPHDNEKAWNSSNEKGQFTYKDSGLKNWMASSAWEETSSVKKGLCQCRKHLSGLVIILYHKILKIYVSRIAESKASKLKSILNLENLNIGESECHRQLKDEREVKTDFYAHEYLKESSTWVANQRERRKSENSHELNEYEDEEFEDDDELGGYDTPTIDTSDDGEDFDEEIKVKRSHHYVEDVSKLQLHFNYFAPNPIPFSSNNKNLFKFALRTSLLLAEEGNKLQSTDTESDSENLVAQSRSNNLKKKTILCPGMANRKSLTINCLNEGILFMNHQMMQAENIASLWGSTGATSFIKIYQIYLQHFNKIPLFESTKPIYEMIVKLLDSSEESESSFQSFIFNPTVSLPEYSDVEMIEAQQNCEFLPTVESGFKAPAKFSQPALFNSMTEIKNQTMLKVLNGANDNAKFVSQSSTPQDSSGSSDEDVVEGHPRYDDSHQDTGKMFKRLKLKPKFEFDITFEKRNENKRIMLDQQSIISQITREKNKKIQLESKNSPITMAFEVGAEIARRIEMSLKDQRMESLPPKKAQENLSSSDEDDFYFPLDGEVLKEKKREITFQDSKYSFINEEFEEYRRLPYMLELQDTEGSEGRKIDFGHFPMPNKIPKESKVRRSQMGQIGKSQKGKAEIGNDELPFVVSYMNKIDVYNKILKEIRLERDGFPSNAKNSIEGRGNGNLYNTMDEETRLYDPNVSTKELLLRI